MPVGYGKKIRNAVESSRKKAHAKYMCPSCSRKSVKRESHGIWRCMKCSSKYASGAYEFV